MFLWCHPLVAPIMEHVRAEGHRSETRQCGRLGLRRGRFRPPGPSPLRYCLCQFLMPLLELYSEFLTPKPPRIGPRRGPLIPPLIGPPAPPLMGPPGVGNCGCRPRPVCAGQTLRYVGVRPRNRSPVDGPPSSAHSGRNSGGRTIGPALWAGRAIARNLRKPVCGYAAIPPFAQPPSDMPVPPVSRPPALPCPELPGQAAPCQAEPRHATSGRVEPILSEPSVSSLTSPCQAAPRLTNPHLASPRHASTRQA
jgi:hypothetical protein